MERGKRGRKIGLAALCFLLVLALAACARKKPEEIRLPRADPGYLQWLERQSMAGMAPSLAAQVSGSERMWLQSSAGNRPDVLLAAAPNWLWLEPAEGGRLFADIADKKLPSVLAGAGVTGLFLASTSEKAAIWTDPGAANELGASFNFDAAAGSAEDFERLAAQAEKDGIQLGGELPGAATGLGPDFMLQARQAPRHGGLYAMLPVPEREWKFLPRAAGAWDCKVVEDIAPLVESGLLPDRLAREGWAWASPGGWAATGEVMGADGVTRRWIYRYSSNPYCPVFLWQDPSGLARQVLSAAIIQQTGLRGQTLTALGIEPMLGLEPAGAPDMEQALSPGLGAANAMAEEIHRYGGWAILEDALPPPVLRLALTGAVDFFQDGQSAILAEQAMDSGNPEALAGHLQAVMRLEQSRLARGPARKGRETASGAAGSTLLAAAFRVALPGLAFFSLQELAGSGDLHSGALEPSGDLARLLRARRQLGVAEGSLVKVTGGRGGWFATLCRLPSGDIWLCAANFSPDGKSVSVGLPQTAREGIDIISGKLPWAGGDRVELELDGRQARHVLLKTMFSRQEENIANRNQTAKEQP